MRRAGINRYSAAFPGILLKSQAQTCPYSFQKLSE